MRIPACGFFLRVTVVLLMASAFSAPAAAQEYLITNDDWFAGGISFYTIGSSGELTFASQVPGPGLGIGGGYFGTSRLTVIHTRDAHCIFASDALTGEVFGMVAGSGLVAGSATGSSADTGSSNGIGVAGNARYLYASFSDTSSVGTFKIEAGCQLTFIGDVAAGGLNGGIVDGMAVRGNLLIATYTDGSIESFRLASGIPRSNGDKQFSTASADGETYPNGIEITQDGHFAIFGDTSTSSVVEVSDISSGRLTPTTVYQTHSAISSSNVMLSPDETILFISNTQGDTVSAAFFDHTTGRVTSGCKSRRIRGYVDSWSYLGGMAPQHGTGNGGGVYVAEFGGPSGIGVLNLAVDGSTCTLQEARESPVPDLYSWGLLSLGRVVVRDF
jgi:hypothetical protein